MVANPERGEVEIVLGDQKGVICAEMARLAQLSGLLRTKTLQDVYQRIAGAEPLAMYNALECMLVDGDVKAMKAAIVSPSDFQTISNAVLKSLSAFLGDNDGKKSKSETGKS